VKLNEENESLKANDQKINVKIAQFEKILWIKLNFMAESLLIDKPESIQFLKTHVEEALGQ
jgi:hypothetical protein